jgi:hypothetical protein
MVQILCNVPYPSKLCFFLTIQGELTDYCQSLDLGKNSRGKASLKIDTLGKRNAGVRECKGIVADEAACSGKSSHFANLLAVMPRLKFGPLSSQQAGFCPSFRYLRYTRDFGPAAGACGVSISI